MFEGKMKTNKVYDKSDLWSNTRSEKLVLMTEGSSGSTRYCRHSGTRVLMQQIKLPMVQFEGEINSMQTLVRRKKKNVKHLL